MNHTYSSKYRECTCMTIHGKAPTSSPISTENDGSPRLFLKYNYRTKFPCKNNHNTDPCLPANDQKMVCHTLVFIQQIIFSTQHDFKDVRAHCYCASLLRTLFIGHAHATSFSSARTDSKTQQNIERMTFALTWCANIFVGCSVTPTFFSADDFLF